MAEEAKIEAYLVSEVAKMGGETRKVKWVARRGAPDRLVWIPGWRWPRMPEMKRPGKDLEPHQRREHKKLRKMGIACCKLNNIEDIDRFLRG